MTDVKWIKIATDIFDDEKIVLIEGMPNSSIILLVWFKLLCLAGKINNRGVFKLNDHIAYSEEMLATIFRMNSSKVRLAIKTFEEFGMVEKIDGVITLPNWDKHQTLDSYESKKERDRMYQAKRRAEQKKIVNKSSDKSSDVAVSDKEEDIDIYNSLSYARVAPTIEEVRSEILSNDYNTDADAFFSYYSSQGWSKSNGLPVTDWKAELKHWHTRENGKASGKKRNTKGNKKNSFCDFPQHDYDLEELARRAKE